MVHSVKKIRAVSLQRPLKNRRTKEVVRKQPVKRVLRFARHRNIKLIQSKRHAVGFAVSLFCILLFKLYIRLNLLELSYQLEETRQAILLEDSKLREMKVMNAKSLSAKSLTELAQGKLNLSPTLPQQIRKLETKEPV